MKALPLVSVNIRTWNSEKMLEKCLRSIKNQTYKNTEIVVSDGYSTDKSVKIAKKYGARVHYVAKLGDAKYLDYKKSRGTYIFSLDSDQIASRGLIKRCVDLCEKKGFDAVSISEISLIQEGTLVEKLIAYDKWVIDQNHDANKLFGAIFPRFFRRTLFDRLQWPKGLSVFDDIILYSKLLDLGAKVTYISDETIGHHEVTSWNRYIKKWFRYGKGYMGAMKERPSTTATHSLPRRSYVSKAAISKPHYFLGLLFLYGVKCSAATFGVLAYFLGQRVEDDALLRKKRT